MKLFILLLNILLLLLFIILLFIYSKNKNIENFNNNIIFINDNELFFILTRDYDNYFKSFYHNDFYSRQIKNIEEYNINIKKSISNFNEKEIIKIKKCIEKVNLKLISINLYWFNGKKALEIPWKIGCIIGKLYENGLPHTREDVIILSKEHINNYSNLKLSKTLLHEKVHIYQKFFKKDIEKYIHKNNFIKIKEKSLDDNIRANPDLDNWIYKDSNNLIYKAEYNKYPKSVEDINYSFQNSQSYEHPFEKMAIYIENNYF
jgi:hypothetical protein